MEKIIEKLKKIEDVNPAIKIWDKWSLEEQKELLYIYLIISKNENHIFKLIYSYHGCDSWEDIFRDYDKEYLKDKESGVEVALDAIDKIVNEIEEIK